MKNIFSGFLTLALALAIIMPAAAPALADSTSDTKPQLSSLAFLTIKAPNMVNAGQLVTITVFGKRGHEAIAGASVYAVKTGDLVITAEAVNYTAVLGEYESLAETKGTLFGTTGSDGTVKGKFSDAGRFMLVATRDGYIPGFSRISVMLAARTALNIKAPGSVAVNKTINISVTERYTGQPVANAAVYGQLITTIKSPPVTSAPPAKHAQPQVFSATLTADTATVIKADPSVSTAAVQLAAELRDSGILLGYTDGKGKVSYAFAEGGYYMLTATKENCAPAFARISVTIADQKKLGVRAPASAAAGQQVTIKAVENNGGQLVEQAAIYAFRPRVIMPPTLRQAPAPADNGTTTATAIDSEISPVTSAEAQILIKENRDRSFLVGYTDSNGEVQATFKEPGLHVLVAVKDGYLPGGSRISIRGIQPAKALGIKALSNMPAGQPVLIIVWEKGPDQPVAKAAVYVLKISDFADIKVVPPTADNGIAKGEADKAREKGTFAGYTDEKGQLAFTFGTSGQYVLAAFKDGYSPAFNYITYTLPVSKKTLYLKAPAEANPGDTVNIGTYDASGNALGNVGIYSLRMEVIAQAAAILQSSTAVDAAVREKYGPMLREKSSFIGYTDNNGQLSTKFSRSGAFMLLAIRDGYLPDFSKINISLAPPTGPVPLPVPVPQSTNTPAIE